MIPVMGKKYHHTQYIVEILHILLMINILYTQIQMMEINFIKKMRMIPVMVRR